EGAWHRRFRRHAEGRYRRHERCAGGKLLRQDGARRRRQTRHRFPQGLYAALRQQDGRAQSAAEELMTAADPSATHDAGMTGLAVRLRGATKVYDNGTVALGPVDLDVKRGEFISLLGPSGCGKSTALRLISGLASQSAGTVQVVHRDAGHG